MSPISSLPDISIGRCNVSQNRRHVDGMLQILSRHSTLRHASDLARRPTGRNVCLMNSRTDEWRRFPVPFMFQDQEQHRQVLVRAIHIECGSFAATSLPLQQHPNTFVSMFWFSDHSITTKDFDIIHEGTCSLQNQSLNLLEISWYMVYKERSRSHQHRRGFEVMETANNSPSGWSSGCLEAGIQRHICEQSKISRQPCNLFGLSQFLEGGDTLSAFLVMEVSRKRKQDSLPGLEAR